MMERVFVGEYPGEYKLFALVECPYCCGSGEVETGGHYEECFGFHWVSYSELCECIFWLPIDNGAVNHD